MKKISILILLLGAQFAFSQTTQKEEQQSPSPSSEINKDEHKVDDTISIAPEFPGGMVAIRKYISSEMDISKFSNSPGTFKSVTTFDVNPDGSISSISTTGNSPILNKEMDRIMKKLKKKWKPGTINGQPVKTKFTMPMGLSI
ncbi:energy transducer TonB [Chryseobacterium sp. D764]|jgi:protein TonB|uniref:energy transducer TonB n=1 Tax=unclassified Chryseobacterium TaxID=2593645 RepID=UPI000987BB17|nr:MULTISPECIES: energy transducer TonB [unclassified Chryseobacterium]QXU48116.1 energy transducer TonB [Chryseobacterium sp. D764]CAD0222684.1 TonB_C domain-containing protein [Chryseobacterium sp. JV274]